MARVLWGKESNPGLQAEGLTSLGARLGPPSLPCTIPSSVSLEQERGFCLAVLEARSAGQMFEVTEPA